MIVRFDDSLPILARAVAEELGQDALMSGIALRDAAGRLSFFAGIDLDAATFNRLSARLRKELGVYARTDRIVAVVNDFGASEILNDASALTIAVDSYCVRLVDRRLVGADWLRTPAAAAAPPPRFVFASLKGGVGRSTALAVAAADFAAKGRRVLAIDLDMEAPGLGAMLLDEGTVPEFGLIDALVENGLSPLDQRFFTDMVGPSALSDRRGRIDVIPAFGRRSIQFPAEVLAKIARAYAEDIGPNGSVSTILDQVSSIVDHFANPTRYDAVLVDSRAGLHETTASAILGLGADVFLFGLNERQSFQGYSVLLAHLARFVEPGGPVPEWVERITMVQGKASAAVEDRVSFVEKCGKLFADAGLTKSRAEVGHAVQLPAAPFKDVPWDDSVPDDVLGLEDDFGPREPIAILEDERFRLFDPSHHNDLLSEQIYKSSFEMLLTRMNEAFRLNEESQI